MTPADYWAAIICRLLTGQPIVLQYFAIPGTWP